MGAAPGAGRQFARGLLLELRLARRVHPAIAFGPTVPACNSSARRIGAGADGAIDAAAPNISHGMNLPNYFLADLPPEASLTPSMISEACQTLKRNRAQYLASRSTASLIKTLSQTAES